MYDIDMLEGALLHRDKHIRELEAERDALAANLDRVCDAVCKEGAGPVVRAVIDSAPVDNLAHLKAEWQAEALANAVAACARIAKGQKKLAWMHSETLADGEEVVGAEGIPYSNKALGAMHCSDEIGRMVTELRRQAEGETN